VSFFSEERANELRAIFFESAQELLQALNEEGLRLEKAPANAEIVRDIRRTVHTLKGDSAACGYHELSELAHALEDVLTPEIAGRSDPALAELVLSAADVFEAFLSAYRSGTQPPAGDVLRVMMQRVMHAENPSGPTLPVPAFEWNEYERLVIAKTAEPACGVMNVGLVIDPKCAMPAAAMQVIWRTLRELGTVLVARPEIAAADPAEMVEAVLATAQSAAYVRQKCDVPGIVSATYVEPYVPAAARAVKSTAQAETEQSNGEFLSGVLEGFAPEAEQALPANAAVDAKPEQPKAERFLPATENLLRVDAERIDTVLDLVGELIIARSTMQQVLADFTKKFGKDPVRTRFADALAKQSQVMYKLQRSVMKIRMVPVEQLFRRFPRVVRDLAKSRNKDVQLVLQGENTDLDKGILDVLAEPMTHLVRNAVDHGVEDPEIRQRAGKPAQGTIRLDAYHQGNQIVIEVSDDGAGIDREGVVAKAVQRGILSPEQAAQLSEEDALNLIFEPSVSTAEQITELSGRGVGMDIVSAVIKRLKGSISIHTERGVGSTFRLRLPLTLAIIKALLFHATNRLYAVPLAAVLEITRAFAGDIHLVEGREVLRIREEVIPLIRIGELAGQQAREPHLVVGTASAGSANDGLHSLAEEQADTRGRFAMDRGKCFIVVVSVGERKFGVVVEKLVGEEELVIKALEDHLVATELVGGASVLGDGRVVLILNLPAMVERLRRKQIPGRAQAANA
jgi:two-component system chemotaxis sensor kinase CheA